MPEEAKSGSHAPDGPSFERLALERLRSSGHRVTRPRTAVLRALAQAARPLSAYGIHDAVAASGGRVDVVSVYRILATLAQLGVVHHVGIVDGYVACSLGSEHGDTAGHVVCEECGTVAELNLTSAMLDAATDQVATLGFKPIQTKVEVLAVCESCRQV